VRDGHDRGRQRDLVVRQAGGVGDLDLLVQARPLVEVVPPAVRRGDPVQAAQLAERVGVVVDVEVEDALPRLLVAIARDDEERGRLAAPEVAAGLLGRVQRCKEALREAALRCLERVGGGEPDGR
jgi:hypothetical protein